MKTKKPNIPAEVKRHRNRLGLSQTEFAKLCNLSQPVISQLELNDHEPRFSTLRAIARGIGRKLNFGNAKGNIFS